MVMLIEPIYIDNAPVVWGSISKRRLLVLMYTLWKNEQVYDAKFETKKQQKHEAPAARDNKLIAQFVS
jgi:hypothetical protein